MTRHRYFYGINLGYYIWINFTVFCPPTMDPECRDSKLKRLDLYLRGLPSSVATGTESFSRYNFAQFSVDPDWVEAIGSVPGAVNRELEVRLGTHANGPIEFVERGPQVEGLVEILDHYSKQFPDDILLATWIDDALAGAMHTYSKANLPVSMQFTKYLRIIIAKTNVFDPVMQQLPYFNTAETTTRENCQSSATESNKKRPL